MILTDDEFDKLKNKNKELFARLFKTYYQDIVHFFILKTSSDRNLSEELASRTFYSAFISVGNIENKKKIKYWLKRIAVRRFQDYLREKYRNLEHTNSEYDINDVFKSGKDEIPDDVIKKEKFLLLRDALNNLKTIYRKILVLKYVEQKKAEEISVIIDKNYEATKSLIRRAKAALKKEVNKRSC